jgi:hypothetical protein
MEQVELLVQLVHLQQQEQVELLLQQEHLEALLHQEHLQVQEAKLQIRMTLLIR